MAKLKGLGKGLDALLSAAKVDIDADILAKPVLAEVVTGLQQLKIEQVQPGKYQPRRVFDENELTELAASIEKNGVIQPIIVRLIGKSKYEIIAGERRWRASQMAGLKVIPAVIREFSDEEALAVSLIENIQRKDLNIVEEAEGYRRLIKEFGLTHEALAQITGKSRSNISNTLRLLNLNQEVLDMLLDHKIDMGHARALLPLPEADQCLLAREIVMNRLTTSEVEKRVSRMVNEKKYARPIFQKDYKDPDIERLEGTLADKIGMSVSIKHTRAGNGKLTINYSSVDELEGLLDILR